MSGWYTADAFPEPIVFMGIILYNGVNLEATELYMWVFFPHYFS